ncbi:MAG TPA: PDZ domain-containing protein [Fimbriimonadaceae bacterium]
MPALIVFAIATFIVAAVIGLIVAGLWKKESGQFAFWLVCAAGAGLFLAFRKSPAGLGVQYDPTPAGAFITNVVPGSTADQYNLKVGMSIVRVDNANLTENTELSSIVARHHPGDVLHLAVMTSSGLYSMDVVLGVKDF